MKIIKDFLTFNPYSRPGTKIKKIKGLVVHWVANKNTTALQNRNFFESRKNQKKEYGSAHYIIDPNGDIIQCVPDNEIAYHVGALIYTEKARLELGYYPNNCTIGVECCHIDDAGNMTTFTYQALIELLHELMQKYELNSSNLYRHYDITEKLCHKWFVENPNEWEKLKGDLK